MKNLLKNIVDAFVSNASERTKLSAGDAIGTIASTFALTIASTFAIGAQAGILV